MFSQEKTPLFPPTLSRSRKAAQMSRVVTLANLKISFANLGGKCSLYLHDYVEKRFVLKGSRRFPELRDLAPN